MNGIRAQFAAACALAAVCAPAARAEEEAQGPAVVVTAHPAAKAPGASRIVGGEELDAAKTASLLDLQELAPGLVVTTSTTAYSQPYIRGIGTDIESIGVENAVALYVDGVYQTRPLGEWLHFPDVDRVEVLKGPQGVFFARDATGGAINVVTRAPSRVAEGRFDLQAGSYGQQVARGTVSGPLADGVAYARLSLLHDHEDGDTWNALLGRRTNGSDVDGLRGALELTPGGAFDLTLNAGYLRKRFEPVVKPLYPDANPLFTVFHATVIDDPRTVMQDQPFDVGLTHATFGATARWEIGTLYLTSTTAFARTDYKARQADLDGTEIPLFQVGALGIPVTSRSFSQELTLASDAAARLNWTAQLSYQREKAESAAWNFVSPLFGLSTTAASAVGTEVLSLGGQANYALDERWRLTAGTRFVTASKELEYLRTYANGMLTGSMSDARRWTAATPRLALEYAPDRHGIWYVSAAKGFKSGGFNTLAVQPGFAPETAVNYEAGFKGNWLDGRLRANLAAFATRYDDMQVAIDFSNGGVLQSVIENAPKAASRGIEAGVTAQPTGRIDLSAQVQWLRARFVDFATVDPHAPAAAGPVDLAGNPLTRAPNLTAHVAAQYAWPAPDGDGRAILRVENAYRSKVWFTPFQSDYTSSAALSVWNVALSREPAQRSGWYGSLFVKNLTNRTYVSNITDTPGLGYLAFMAPGRTLGAQGGYRF